MNNTLEPSKKIEKANFFRVVALRSPESKSEESLVGTVVAFFPGTFSKWRPTRQVKIFNFAKNRRIGMNEGSMERY